MLASKFRYELIGRDQNRRHETGGSAPTGEGPSIHPALRHNVLRLPAYIPSRSGNSGTPRATAGKAQTYRLEASRSKSTAPLKKTIHFALQFRKGRIESFEPRIDDDGALRIQPIQAQANGLAKPPLEAIAHHGRAEFAGNRKTDSRSRAFRLPHIKGCKKRGGKASTPLVNSSKIL
jgi:hypothetical protein